MSRPPSNLTSAKTPEQREQDAGDVERLDPLWRVVTSHSAREWAYGHALLRRFPLFLILFAAAPLAAAVPASEVRQAISSIELG